MALTSSTFVRLIFDSELANQVKVSHMFNFQDFEDYQLSLNLLSLFVSCAETKIFYVADNIL